MKLWVNVFLNGLLFPSVISMENRDLKLARLKLTKENLSLVIVKNGILVFETNKSGINGFLQAIEKRKENLVGASAADKIVGVAASMLSVYSGLASMFALTISEAGIKVLEDNNLVCVFQKKVSNLYGVSTWPHSQAY